MKMTRKYWSKKSVLPLAVTAAILISVSVNAEQAPRAAIKQMQKPAAVRQLQVNPGMLQIYRCSTMDPAVEGIVITNKYVSRGRGVANLSVTIKNRGRKDFISNPNQASVSVQSYNPRVSGPSAYKTVGSRNFGRINAGASIQIPFRLLTDNMFIEWGHRTARPGECQTSREIIVRINYDPDILMDANPNNDDCNLRNNVKKLTVNYMVQCPW